VAAERSFVSWDDEMRPVHAARMGVEPEDLEGLRVTEVQEADWQFDEPPPGPELDDEAPEPRRRGGELI
jgi:hypothetical protein